MDFMTRLATRWWHGAFATVAILFGMKRSALERYRLILQSDPNSALAWATVGNLLMELGERDAALDAFRQLVARHPQNAEAWFNLGYILEQGEQLADAEASFRRAIELRPSIDRAWYGLGLVLIRAGRLQEAVPAFRKTIELQHFSPYGYYQLGMTLHHLGDAAGARGVVDELRKFEPRYAATLERDISQTAPAGASAPVPRSPDTHPTLLAKEAMPSTP
jgi:tetratricopeptide (TPR) repeat protein